VPALSVFLSAGNFSMVFAKEIEQAKKARNTSNRFFHFFIINIKRYRRRIA